MNIFKQFKSSNRCAPFKTLKRVEKLSTNKTSENGLNDLNLPRS